VKISKLYIESEFPLLGGFFIKLFDLRTPYMFLIFWKLRGSFSSLSFCFLKISKFYFKSKFLLLWRGLFFFLIFDLKPCYVYIYIFLTFGGLF